MKTISKLMNGAALMTFGVLMVAAAVPANAYDRDWHGHEVYARRDWHRHYGPGPGVVYAPPVVYEPPPPVESPGLNLIIPLNFR